MTLNKISFLIIFSIAFTLTSCSTNDDAGQIIDNTPSTFEIIANSPNHNTLEQLLIDNGLDQVLNDATFTVFAPTDEAFEAIDLSGLSNDEIYKILLYHVLVGNAQSSDLSNGFVSSQVNETYSGNGNTLSLYVNVDGGIVLNGISTVTSADNSASNGVVHVVDKVMTLPNLATFVSANSNLSNLEIALTQENLIPTFNLSESPAPFTLFAPNNSAFQNLIDEDLEDGLESIEDILGLDNLTDILTYHVLANNALRVKDITDGMTPTTIEGSSFTLNIEEGNVNITDNNNRVSTIVSTNATATNGVLHVIDNVLLP